MSLAADRLYRLLSVWMPEGFRAFRSVAVRMFAAGMVGLPLVAGREIVVPIDPLMIVPGRWIRL